MEKIHRTQAQLLDEMAALRQRVAELEALEAQRRQMEEALEGSEAKYRATFEASTDAVFLETLEGRVLDCNASACHMYGYSKDELVRLSVSDLVPESVAETLPDIITEEVTTGGIFVEALGRRNDGQVFPTEVSTRLIALRGNRRVIVYVRDVTKRKQDELALREAHDELEQRVEARTAELLVLNKHLQKEIVARNKVEKALIAIQKRLQYQVQRQEVAQQALRESEEKLKAQYRGIPVPTYTWQKVGEDFVLMDHNAAAEAITLGHIAEYVGKTAREMYGDMMPEVLDEFTSCFIKKTTLRREMLYPMRSTGETKYLAVSYVFVPPDLVMVHTEDITERKQAEDMLRAFSRHTIGLQEEERRRVGRELHDGVNQTLSALRFRVEGIEERLPAADRATQEEVEKARQLLDSAIGEVRRISQNLRPSVLDDLGLESAVRSLCHEFSDRTRVSVQVETSQLPKALSGEVETTFYRILQEALRNVEKHAQAGRVDVGFAREGAWVTMRVQDNGRGMDAPLEVAGQRGLGMESMKERAALAGGELSVRSARGQGTELLVRLPVGE